MRYGVHLVITYRFDRPSGGGRQHLRILPAHVPGRQAALHMRLEVTPAPVEERRFRDFFGTEVVELVMPSGLTEAVFDLHARVERLGQGIGPDISTPLAALGEELAAVRVLGADSPHHFLGGSPRIPDVAEIAAFAAGAVRGAPTVRAAVEALGKALHAEMRFDAGATEVDTPIAAAFAGRHGVCQDFSQIMIAGLRSLGIPAAYVAGFLRTLPPPGKPRLEGADAMHEIGRAHV